MPVIDDISKGLKKGIDEAGKGIKEGINQAGKGLKAVSEKANDAVETYEINQEIDKLEEEIKRVKMQIGDLAVDLLAKGTTLDPAIEELVKDIKGIEAQIEGKKAKIEEIKND